MFYFLKALISIIFPLTSIHAAEMIFGEEQLDNGIKIIFEAAPKDQIFPENKFLEENALLTQPWVMEPKKKVKDILKELSISDLKIKEFVRFKIGE